MWSIGYLEIPVIRIFNQSDYIGFFIFSGVAE